MAEATPVTTFDDFCTERDILLAAIAGYEAAPDLETIDDLSAARVRLQVVQDAIPGLCNASERYQAAERAAAILAAQAPIWSAAASEKVTALASITTLVTDLLAAVEAYDAQHQQQMGCLFSLGHYSPTFRSNYQPMTSRLAQIVAACVSDNPAQHGWGRQQLTAFDAIGKSAALPSEY